MKVDHMEIVIPDFILNPIARESCKIFYMGLAGGGGRGNRSQEHLPNVNIPPVLFWPNVGNSQYLK